MSQIRIKESCSISGNAGSSVADRIIALLLIFVCLALGILGLVLPILPGLLFLAIAAIIAARHFPAVDARLRSNPWTHGVIQEVDRMSGLALKTKLRLSGLLAARMVSDSLAMVARFARLSFRYISKEFRR